MAKRESKFQKEFIDELKSLNEDILVLKNDPTYVQGIPDLTVLAKDKWMCFEIKRTRKDARGGLTRSQAFYLKTLNKMSYAALVYPENKNEVLDEVKKFIDL